MLHSCCFHWSTRVMDKVVKTFCFYKNLRCLSPQVHCVNLGHTLADWWSQNSFLSLPEGRCLCLWWIKSPHCKIHRSCDCTHTCYLHTHPGLAGQSKNVTEQLGGSVVRACVSTSPPLLSAAACTFVFIHIKGFFQLFFLCVSANMTHRRSYWFE